MHYEKQDTLQSIERNSYSVVKSTTSCLYGCVMVLSCRVLPELQTTVNKETVSLQTFNVRDLENTSDSISCEEQCHFLNSHYLFSEFLSHLFSSENVVLHATLCVQWTNVKIILQKKSSFVTVSIIFIMININILIFASCFPWRN